MQKVLNEQGVTMVMDTRVAELQLDAFRALQEQGELTLRVYRQAAREITPDDAPDVASVPQAIAKRRCLCGALSSTAMGLRNRASR